MLKDLFEIPEHLSSRQKNWLNMVTAIPSVKEVFGDVVTKEDVLLAEEAKQFLEEKI